MGSLNKNLFNIQAAAGSQVVLSPRYLESISLVRLTFYCEITKIFGFPLGSGLVIILERIDYQGCGWCIRNSKWSDLFFLLCQQLWPSLSLSVTEAAEGRPDRLTLHFLPPSPCRSLPRCERSGCRVGTWWSRGIDGARNDEEMRGGDGQAAKMNVSHFLRGWNFTVKCKKRKRQRGNQ